MAEPLTQAEREGLQVKLEDQLVDAVTRTIRELSWCGMNDGTAISGLARSTALVLVALATDERERDKLRNFLPSLIAGHEQQLLSIIKAQEAHK